MKRLTLALWSMMIMLFLGMGAAWAQDKPTAPTFDQASGTAVDWGTVVNLTNENEDPMGTYSYEIFVTVNGSDDFVTKTDVDKSEITSAVLNYGSWTVTGPVTIRAAVAKVTEEDIIEAWSDITTATYTVNSDAARPAAPTFNPASGEVPAGTAVHLTNGTESDETPKLMYYNYKTTTNNFKNTKTQAQLTSALGGISKNLIAYDAAKGIEITQDRPIINAATASIDADGNVTWSEVVTTYFKMGEAKPSAPIFSIDGGNVDENSQLRLTMSALDQANFAEIWYVINGTGNEFNVSNSSNLPRDIDPTAEGQLIQYSSRTPITFTKSQKISAAVVWEEGNSDLGNPLTWSEVVTKEFNYVGVPPVEKPATPVISPANDAMVKIGQLVTITCAETEGVTIRYTTDGNNPTAESAVYTAPFPLTEDMLIPQMGGKVFALKINAAAFKGDVMSDVTEVGLNVSPDKPVFTPDGSAEVAANSTVTITCVPSQAKIYYTLDGKTPDDEGSNATLYTEPIKLTETTTIKARAILGQYTGSTATATFTVSELPETVKAPTFDQASGTAVDWGTAVNLTHENEDDEMGTYFYEIYVTVNGSDDFVTKTDVDKSEITSSYAVLLSSESWTVTGPVTIKAAVAKVNEEDIIKAWSDITTATYTVNADAARPAAPTFNPASGEVPAGTAVHLTNGTESDETPKLMYFNYKTTTNDFKNVKTKAQLDGALTGNFKKFTAYDAAKGIEITQDRPIINAATASIDAENNVTWSEVVTTYFKMGEAKPSAPTFSPDGGKVGDDNNTVTLTMSEVDQAKMAEIWYVVNGTGNEFNVSNSSGLPRDVDPEAEGQLILYQGPITITKSQTIHAAVVWEEGNSDMGNPLTWSEVVKREFTFTGTPVAPKPAKPVISPANDANVHIGDKVTITCAETEGVTIRYTTDGNNPTAESAVYTEPFALTEDMLIPQMGGKVFALKINAAAFKDGAMSDVVEVGLNVFPDKPVFTPDGSAEVTANSTVTITCVPSQAKIYYTLDGTTPDDEGSNATLYTEPIKLTETTTIKARAILGQYTGSTATATFTVKADTVPTDPEKDTVATPTFNPAGGEVAKDAKVEIACATDSAKLYYTTDGTEPTAESTEYTAAIEINEAMTIKAIAIKGEAKSAVATAAYTIKEVANEGLELAGVSVYPNPSNGVFTLELPVAARVEVYGLTGVMVQRIEAGAGLVTMNIDHSGIYFLRITAEGRTTVKRIVVR